MASSFLFESPFIKLHNERKMWEKWGGLWLTIILSMGIIAITVTSNSLLTQG